VTTRLASLLSRYGVRDVQTRAHTISYPPDTPEGRHFAENLRLYYLTLVPFMRRWIRVPDDYDAIYQQALKEMQQPDFTASWDFLTAWGTSPGPASLEQLSGER
jgi:hypothetical protein